MGFARGARAESTPPNAKSLKDWTLLVFLNGHNNLDPFGTLDLNEMEQVGSTQKLNVVVQWASLGKPTKRVYVEKDSLPNQVTSPVVAEIGVADMGDWRTLRDFVQWGMETYPAKHTFVVVWNHGSGWRLKRSQVGIQDISNDDLTGNVITTPELGRALREASLNVGRRIDLYGSDACLMGMVEVASEMSDRVDYFVGAQELEPGDGWPYGQFLARWDAFSHAMPKDVIQVLVEEFVKSYQGGAQGRSEVTLSGFDLSKLPRVEQATQAFGIALSTLDTTSRRSVVAAANASQGFYYSDYRDIIDFTAQLTQRGVSGLSAVSQELAAATRELVVANGTSAGYRRATGASIWLPPSRTLFNAHEGRYQELQFQSRTAWADALRGLYP